MGDQTHESLFRQTEGSYGESFKAHLLEQYKLYVQSADSASERRVASVRYLLTINAALIAAYGLQSLTERTIFAVPIAVAGIALSLLTYFIIRSFRDLNTVKFKVIHELEEHLPAALYGYEWQLAGKGHGKEYRPTTHIEQWMPLVFLVIHVLALAAGVFFAVCGLPDWAR